MYPGAHTPTGPPCHPCPPPWLLPFLVPEATLPSVDLLEGGVCVCVCVCVCDISLPPPKCKLLNQRNER